LAANIHTEESSRYLRLPAATKREGRIGPGLVYEVRVMGICGERGARIGGGRRVEDICEIGHSVDLVISVDNAVDRTWIGLRDGRQCSLVVIGASNVPLEDARRSGW